MNGPLQYRATVRELAADGRSLGEPLVSVTVEHDHPWSGIRCTFITTLVDAPMPGDHVRVTIEAVTE